jgi:hypothetical protein
MKVVTAVLCLAFALRGGRPARAEEVQPAFEGLERAADAVETYRLNALEIVHEGMSGSFPTIFVGRSNWWRPVRGKFRYGTSYDDRIQPPLLSEEDAVAMANEYNRRLRVYLGLAPVATDGGRDGRPFGLSLGGRW